MRRFIVPVMALAACTYAAPAAAHGCHASWQNGGREGWHSHGKRCEPRQGIGVSERAKARPKKQAI